MMQPSRNSVLQQLASIVSHSQLDHPTRVAVDGITASGKSTLARELSRIVMKLGRPVVHLTMDGYHNPREHRYRKGRLSAAGYYEDAYDFEALARRVLLPLGPGGDRRYRERMIDLASDQPADEPAVEAPQDAVLIIDGTFLQKPEIRDLWDHRIFVNTSFDVALRRGCARDAELLGGEAEARKLFEARYHAAGRIYLDSVRPITTATVILDNDNPDYPSLRLNHDVTGAAATALGHEAQRACFPKDTESRLPERDHPR